MIPDEEEFQPGELIWIDLAAGRVPGRFVRYTSDAVVEVDVGGHKFEVMIGRINAAGPAATPRLQPAEAVSGDDWRAFRENRPGFCPCGIPRADCSYHADDGT